MRIILIIILTLLTSRDLAAMSQRQYNYAKLQMNLNYQYSVAMARHYRRMRILYRMNVK